MHFQFASGFFVRLRTCSARLAITDSNFETFSQGATGDHRKAIHGKWHDAEKLRNADKTRVRAGGGTRERVDECFVSEPEFF